MVSVIQAANVVLLVCSTSGLWVTSDEDNKKETLQFTALIESVSRLDQNSALFKFLRQIPISEDFRFEGMVPDPKLEHYFVSNPSGTHQSLFHRDSRVFLISTNNESTRFWLSTRNKHSQTAGYLEMNCIVEINTKDRTLVSVLVPASRIELRREKADFLVIRSTESSSLVR